MNKNLDINTFRHSFAHVMAHAVKNIYSDVKLGIGPAIENGFYYDFDLPEKISDKDLEKIEREMRKIIKKNTPFECLRVNKEQAAELLKDEPYKLELLNELPSDEATFYKETTFMDLCKGPHVDNTGKLKFFKLLKVAGSYWRGNEKNQMLQRIYGVAFSSQEELENYLQFLKEAEKRDHRKLGQTLDIFSIYEEAGAGFVYYSPNGAMLKHIIEDFIWNENCKRGYQQVITPHIARVNLWKKSGHYDHYKENMYFFDVDNETQVVKPMNCPGHILIYNNKLRSYRDLPIRFAEFGTVYRYEKSGVLHGLLRVRGFTQDDAHIFCMQDQLQEEITSILGYINTIMSIFDFKYDVFLSTRPENYVGSDENWDKATKALSTALSKMNIPYAIDPGEGVFYGPKIDIKLKDALGRYWQGPTVQVDFNLPERFALKYVDKDGNRKTPIMIHRVILGSLERFIGAIIEHYAGAFPVWLAPVQVKILTISNEHEVYGDILMDKLLTAGVRADKDYRKEKIGYKIRAAQTEKIPFMLIVGDKEVSEEKIAVRHRSSGDKGSMTIESFLETIKEIIDNKE